MTTATVPTPALYECVLTHERHEDAQHKFRHIVRLWLIDLDESTRPAWPPRILVSFRSADHLGDPRCSIRENIDHFLLLRDIDLRGGRVLMLAQARALGHVFDPITIFWCHDHAGNLACIVAEVRNTFGERHCYLLRPDEEGRARIEKDFYVSPFFTVDGHYLVRFFLDREHLSVTFVLRRPGSDDEQTAFVARLQGQRTPTVRKQNKAVLGHPLAAYRTTMLIHYQSWRLRRKGLPLRRRRYHPQQPGVDRPQLGMEGRHDNCQNE